MENTNKRQFLGSKIGVSLLIPYLIVSLSILIGIFALIYYSYRNQIGAIERIQEEVATRGGEKINNYISGIVGKLDLTRRNIACVSCADQRNQSIVKNLSEQDPSIFSASIINTDGLEVNKFNKYKTEIVLENVSKEDIFTKAISGLRYIGPVYISDYGLPAISISLPITDLSNRIIGALSAEVDLSPMWETATSIRVGKTGYAYVVDHAGGLIAYRDISSVKAGINLKNIAIVNAFINKKSGAEFYPSFTGETVFGSWQSVVATGWGIIVELPQKEITGDLSIFLIIGTVAFLVFLLSVFVILEIVYKRLLTPISLLGQGVLAAREGNLAYRIPLKLDNELGELADSFNETAGSLQKNRQALEDALHDVSEEEAKLIASINSLPSGFVIINKKGEILISNGAAQKLFDTDSKGMTLELIIKRFGEKLDFDKRFREVLASRQTFIAEEIDYENKILRIEFAPVLTTIDVEREGLIGVVVAIYDITDEKLLERAEKEFLALASHEMRTPLTIIRGYAERLLKVVPDEKQKSMINDVRESSVGLLDIVNKFLSVTTLEQKDAQFNKETFSLIELAQEVVTDLQMKAGDKKLTLAFNLPISLPSVLADRRRVKEVLVNLIANAIQYTDKGTVTISMEQSGSAVKTTIADTGAGIPQDHQTELFKKFHTIGEHFMRTKEYGSGLGLYISKMMVEGMGGTIALEKSEIGVGSVFSFALPVAPVIPIAPANAAVI